MQNWISNSECQNQTPIFKTLHDWLIGSNGGENLWRNLCFYEVPGCSVLKIQTWIGINEFAKEYGTKNVFEFSTPDYYTIGSETLQTNSKHGIQVQVNLI